MSWYNGHPAFAKLAPDLSKVKHVTIVGQGNVALDVARILLKDADALATTDLPEHVLAVLRASAVETVDVVGRRGPAQVAFTTKEFREMLALPDVRFEGPSQAYLDEALAEVARVGGSEERMRKRLLGLMAKGSSPASNRPSKKFKLSFLRSPKAFLPGTAVETGQAGSTWPPVKRVKWALNALLPPPTHAPSTTGDPPNTPEPSNPVSTAVPTGDEVETTTDFIVESVGYRSEPLHLRPGEAEAAWPEGWFDERKGRVRNVGGRVVSAEGEVVRSCISKNSLRALRLTPFPARSAGAQRLHLGLARARADRRHRPNNVRFLLCRRPAALGPSSGTGDARPPGARGRAGRAGRGECGRKGRRLGVVEGNRAGRERGGGEEEQAGGEDC